MQESYQMPIKIVAQEKVPAKFGIGRSTFFELRKSPGFPAPVRIGSRVGYIEHELDAWLMNQRDRH
ncbi:MAG: AlpA family phage regulatory protein [Xanthomonadaceae bacterium]|nr:AlpA family phage regulatory protein [Xanthomonadaceae bacterium]